MEGTIAWSLISNKIIKAHKEGASGSSFTNVRKESTYAAILGAFVDDANLFHQGKIEL